MQKYKPQKTGIMGVLNITPDSFSDGGDYFSLERAVTHAVQMVEEGAEIIDVGGESTRPGSEPVSIDEECTRVLPIIEQLSKILSVPISIDTCKPEVARAAVAAGANMLNDITGLTNSEMLRVAAESKMPVVLMHIQGQPKTMQENPEYIDVIIDIKDFFVQQISAANAVGVTDLILDPGIGFGKSVEHNLIILKRLHEFSDLGYPLLVGPSRKNFIGKITGLPTNDRVEGTVAAVVMARWHGADWVRVHDVKECHRALQVIDAIRKI